nr:alpha/beta hydrolase [Ruegeria lacuscaerulensis]
MGEGARRTLALHCTMAHSGAWSGLAAALDDQATLIAPDMLSHGSSPDWGGKGNYFDRVTETAAQHLSEPMDVIGHSMGGMIALRLAVEFPDLVRSAVLIEPVFFAIAAQDAPRLLRQHDEDARPYAEARAAGDMELAARTFNRMWGTDDSPCWPDLSDKKRAAMIRGVHVVAAVEGALFQDTHGLLKPGMLDRANMPVLILGGSKTHPVIPAVIQGLCRRLPNAQTVVIDGAGHMVPISHPKGTAACIQNFWASQPSVSG